jgi:hypothetical protein
VKQFRIWPISDSARLSPCRTTLAFLRYAKCRIKPVLDLFSWNPRVLTPSFLPHAAPSSGGCLPTARAPSLRRHDLALDCSCTTSSERHGTGAAAPRPCGGLALACGGLALHSSPRRLPARPAGARPHAAAANPFRPAGCARWVTRAIPISASSSSAHASRLPDSLISARLAACAF